MPNNAQKSQILLLSGELSLAEILSELVSGMVFSVDSNDAVLDGALVDSIPDPIGGRSFTASGAARPTEVAGPNDANRAFRTSTTTYLGAADDDGLELDDGSYMFAVVGMAPVVGSYTVWGGNGNSAINEGVRFFGINNNAMGIYPGRDSDGTQSAFLEAGAFVANTWFANVWSYDAFADLARFSSSVTDSTTSGSGARRDVPDVGNPFHLNGGGAGVSYRSIKNFAYAGLWKRPAGVAGYSEAELEAVRDHLIAMKLGS